MAHHQDLKHHRDQRQRRTLIAAGTLALGAVAKAPGHVIKIVARKFVFVPSEIRVKRGETVLLQFTAPKVPMGFNLPDFAVRADIMPGIVSTLRLTLEKAGSFGFLCDVFCGSGHEEMGGTLIVS